MTHIVDRNQLIEYLRTPAGCAGGNIAGKNWLFSIEFGREANLPDLDNLIVDHEHDYVSDEEGRVVKVINECPFNQRIAKFEAVKHAWKIGKYIEFAVEVRMFTRSSQFYKGNVGAFQFKHDDDASFDKLRSVFGGMSKEQLRELEISVRAEMFQRWVKDYSPSCICCFGIGTSERFFKAFSDIDERPDNWRKLEGFRYYHDVINGGKTNLFIIPHPTAKHGQGLTNDTRIKAYGEMVRETMVQNGFNVV